MSRATPLLGPQGARTKTSVYLTPAVRKFADQYADLLGIPLNAVFSMAMAMFAARMAPAVVHTGKRKALLKQIREEFEALLKEVESVS